VNKEKPKTVNLHQGLHQKKPRPQLAAPWKPGESGNPLGRPLGSRNKLSASRSSVQCRRWIVEADWQEALVVVRISLAVEIVQAATVNTGKELGRPIENTTISNDERAR
jgi:hypothetical protein